VIALRDTESSVIDSHCKYGMVLIDVLIGGDLMLRDNCS
jgi:hypothetical protein